MPSRLNSDFNFQEKNIRSNIAKINSLKQKFAYSLNSQLFFKNYEDPNHFENFKKILFEVNLLLKDPSFKEFNYLYQNLSSKSFNNNYFEKDLLVILLALLIDNGFTSSQNSLNKENISFYKTFYLKEEEDNAELVTDLIQSKYAPLFKNLLKNEFNNIFPYCATNDKLSISFDLKEIYFITGNVKYFYLKSDLVHEIPIFKNLKELTDFEDLEKFFEGSGEWTHNIGYEIPLNLKPHFTYDGSLLNNSTENEFHLIKEIINLISNEIEINTIKMLYSWLSSVKLENQLSHLK